MKRSMYTEEQILFALKQAEAGQVVTDVCRLIGISEAIKCRWRGQLVRELDRPVAVPRKPPTVRVAIDRQERR